jgi:glycosyltransferase involved in cell wall biosynthesis
MYHANIAASASRLLGYFSCPLVWGIRQSTTHISDDVPLTRFLIGTGAAFSPTARRIIYNSHPGADTHEQWRYPRRKRVVIPNGIDCARFRPRSDARERLLAELGLPTGSVLIGRVARYAAMKDFPTLFEAFAKIRAAQPQAHLLLVGAGVTRENDELIGLWAAHGAHNGVHFLGQRLEIETFYPGLDVLISTSRSNEGFSNVVFEAIASGCPVVSTDVGNSADARELNAIVIAPGDVDALSAGVLSILMLSPETRERFTHTARIWLDDRFGISACADAYHKLWRSVLA